MNRLREARFRKRKSQMDLFKETGVWQSRISHIENGYLKPTEREKALLSAALEVEKAWLFPEEKNKHGEESI